MWPLYSTWYARYKYTIISVIFNLVWLRNCMQGKLYPERKLPCSLHLTQYINDYLPKLSKIFKNVAQLSWMILWNRVIPSDRGHHTAAATNQLKWLHDRTFQIRFFHGKILYMVGFLSLLLNVMLPNFTIKHETTVIYHNVRQLIKFTTAFQLKIHTFHSELNFDCKHNGY